MQQLGVMDVRAALTTPRLTKSEEGALAQRCASGDADARAELIERSLRLVAMRVFAIGFEPGEIDDAFQAGVVGLIEAIDRFDPHRGVSLATWAWKWIGGGMLRSRSCRSDIASLEEAAYDDGRLDDVVERLDLDVALARLSELERSVIGLRFGLDGLGSRSQRAVGDQHRLSAGQIRRHEARAIGQLRQVLDRVSDRAPH